MLQRNWQTLIKPKQLSVEPGDDPKRVATVVAEPLERGFGLTLGNALRRVLMSSLQGAAITSMQIEGVLHEFSSLPGVLEDVTDIVLNVKSIDLRMYGEGPKRMRLRASGPGEVRAGDPGALAHLYAVVLNEYVLVAADSVDTSIEALTPSGFHAFVDGALRAPAPKR